MTRTKIYQSSPTPRFAACRTSVPRLIEAGFVLLPLLWSASGCSSSEEKPNGEMDPSTTNSAAPSNGPTSTSPSTGGATSDGMSTNGMTNGNTTTGGSSTGGSSTNDSNTGGNDTDDTSAGGQDTDNSNTGGDDTDDTSSGANDTGDGDTSDADTSDGDTDAGSTSAGDTDASASDGADGGNGDVDTGGGSGDPLSPGCGTEFQNPPPDGMQQTVDINGTTRYYLMDVPDNADNETPLMLIFALHGFDMNNIAVVDLFNFTERSGGRAITVWPQGEGPHPGDVPHWGDQVLNSTWGSNEQNYAFLRQIMTDLGERYCIDQERIFIAGFSMGGFFTNQIACDHADWFRGFAPVAGGGPQSCAQSDVQNAIMVQHGTADDIVMLSSGEGSRDFWLEQNGCGTSSSNSLANCQFYDGCPDGKPVAWCTGNYDHYIPDEVASNIWSFFSSL